MTQPIRVPSSSLFLCLKPPFCQTNTDIIKTPGQTRRLPFSTVIMFTGSTLTNETRFVSWLRKWEATVEYFTMTIGGTYPLLWHVSHSTPVLCRLLRPERDPVPKSLFLTPGWPVFLHRFRFPESRLNSTVRPLTSFTILAFVCTFVVFFSSSPLGLPSKSTSTSFVSLSQYSWAVLFSILRVVWTHPPQTTRKVHHYSILDSQK